MVNFPPPNFGNTNLSSIDQNSQNNKFLNEDVSLNEETSLDQLQQPVSDCPTDSLIQTIAIPNLSNKEIRIRKRILNGRARAYSTWEKLPNNLKYDKEVVLAILKKKPQEWRILPQQLNQDKEIVLEILKLEPTEWMHLPNHLKYDRDILLYVLSLNESRPYLMQPLQRTYREENPNPIRHRIFDFWDEMPSYLQEDKEIVMAIVVNYGMILKNVISEFRNDPDIVLAAVRSWGLAFRYASKNLRANKTILIEALSTTRADSRDLFRSSRFELKALAKEKSIFKFADPILQKDEEIQKMAICQHGSAFKFASEALRDDFKYVKIAVETYFPAFRHASSRIKRNLELIKALILINWKIIKYIDEELKADNNLALFALCESKGLAIEYLDIFKNNREGALLVIRGNYRAWKYICESLKYQEEILNDAFSINPEFIGLIHDAKGKCFILDKVKEEPKLFWSLNPCFKKDPEVILAHLANVKSSRSVWGINLNTAYLCHPTMGNNSENLLENIDFIVQAIATNHEFLVLQGKTLKLFENKEFFTKLANNLSIFPFAYVYTNPRIARFTRDDMRNYMKDLNGTISACCCDPILLDCYDLTGSQEDLQLLIASLYNRLISLLSLRKEKFLIIEWIKNTDFLNAIPNKARILTEKEIKKEKNKYIKQYKAKVLDFINNFCSKEIKEEWINRFDEVQYDKKTKSFITNKSFVKNARWKE